VSGAPFHRTGHCPSAGISEQGTAIAQSVKRLGYESEDREIGVRFPAEARYSSLLHKVQTGSGGTLGLLCNAYWGPNPPW
jgi:hypothetical protein